MAIPEILTGMKVVIKNVFKRKETVSYPEVRRRPFPRFKGRHILNRHPDGLEKCIGCELCAGACPADAIKVVGAENTPDVRFSPGERYAQIYQINYLRCIFCGLCVEACPTEALTMTTEYEIAGSSREELIFTKEQLIVDAPIVRHWPSKKELPPTINIDSAPAPTPTAGKAGVQQKAAVVQPKPSPEPAKAPVEPALPGPPKAPVESAKAPVEPTLPEPAKAPVEPVPPEPATAPSDPKPAPSRPTPTASRALERPASTPQKRRAEPTASRRVELELDDWDDDWDDEEWDVP